MGRLRVRLFGRFEVRHERQVVPGLEPRKAQELLAYLLLHNEYPRSREAAANIMWPASNTQQARKYLRHTVWQLRSALDLPHPGHNHTLLFADHDWLQINPEADLWLDTQVFETAYILVQDIPGRKLDRHKAQAAREALDLYRGDLLDGWYDDWCLFERERLQGLYLILLGKQMSYCEARGEYEFGLECGRRALQCDVAHERIHRRMMRLRYLAGDRTGALRQYQRCADFLREELQVNPSGRTVALYELILSDRPLIPRRMAQERDPKASSRSPLTQFEVLEQIKQLRVASLRLQRQLQDTIEAFQVTLDQQDVSHQQLPPRDD